jgi:hypothetical protein
MESECEASNLEQRVQLLEHVLLKLLSELVYRDVVPRGLPSWCSLSDLLSALGGSEHCDAVHESARSFMCRLRRVEERAHSRRDPAT